MPIVSTQPRGSQFLQFQSESWKLTWLLFVLREHQISAVSGLGATSSQLLTIDSVFDLDQSVNGRYDMSEFEQAISLIER